MGHRSAGRTGLRARTHFAGAVLAALVLGCGSNAASGGPPSGPVSPAASGASAIPVATPAGIETPAPTTGSGNPIRIALSGAAPGAIAIDGTTAWVLAGEGGTLIEVDLSAGREVRAIEVGFGGSHLALPVSGTAAVGRFDDSATGSFLLLVDLATGALRGVPSGSLGALTSGDGGIVWALEKDGRLVKVDAEAGAVVDSAQVAIGENVHVEVHWGAGSAWVGSDGLPVVRISGDDLSDRDTIEVETGIPFLFEGGLIWGAGPTELWAIDPATSELARHVPLDDVIEILALDIEGDDAWLAVRRPGRVGMVVRLDLASGALIDEYPVSLPAGVRIDGERTWIASYLSNELLGFER